MEFRSTRARPAGLCHAKGNALPLPGSSCHRYQRGGMYLEEQGQSSISSCLGDSGPSVLTKPPFLRGPASGGHVHAEKCQQRDAIHLLPCSPPFTAATAHAQMAHGECQLPPSQPACRASSPPSTCTWQTGVTGASQPRTVGLWGHTILCHRDRGQLSKH